MCGWQVKLCDLVTHRPYLSVLFKALYESICLLYFLLLLSEDWFFISEIARQPLSCDVLLTVIYYLHENWCQTSLYGMVM